MIIFFFHLHNTVIFFHTNYYFSWYHCLSFWYWFSKFYRTIIHKNQNSWRLPPSW